MQSKGVLIVEDDQAIRDVLRVALQMEGYTVYSAANGREGLELMRTIPRPRLILLDLMMPVMNGFEFLESYEKEAENPPVPVVVVSAFPDQARKIDVAGFVRKPIDLDVLLGFVKKYCN